MLNLYLISGSFSCKSICLFLASGEVPPMHCPTHSTHTHMLMHTHTHTLMHTHSHTHTHTCMQTQICKHTHTCTLTHTFSHSHSTHMCTYMHTHTHLCTRLCAVREYGVFTLMPLLLQTKSKKTHFFFLNCFSATIICFSIKNPLGSSHTYKKLLLNV